jgi:protein-tyrosine-phosphatase
VDDFQGQSFDYVLTVCDNAKESCPVFPGHSKRISQSVCFLRETTLRYTEIPPKFT